MKKLTTIIATMFLLVSCNPLDPLEVITPGPTPSIPGIVDNDEPIISGTSVLPWFSSEEEFIEYMRSDQDETTNERNMHDFDEITHYYKLANPPQDIEIYLIAPGGGVGIVYDTKRNESGEYMMIQYHLGSGYIDWSYNIEASTNWIERPFPEESHILEKEGLTYYISKWTAGTDFLWSADWYNADGYNMRANFPYRFTPEEVLGYISDLERVEIG
jgi:hypothetical protein